MRVSGCSSSKSYEQLPNVGSPRDSLVAFGEFGSPRLCGSLGKWHVIRLRVSVHTLSWRENLFRDSLALGRRDGSIIGAHASSWRFDRSSVFGRSYIRIGQGTYRHPRRTLPATPSSFERRTKSRRGSCCSCIVTVGLGHFLLGESDCGGILLLHSDLRGSIVRNDDSIFSWNRFIERKIGALFIFQVEQECCQTAKSFKQRAQSLGHGQKIAPVAHCSLSIVLGPLSPQGMVGRINSG